MPTPKFKLKMGTVKPKPGDFPYLPKPPPPTPYKPPLLLPGNPQDPSADRKALMKARQQYWHERVEALRGRGRGLRVKRFGNTINQVENSMLGRPTPGDPGLPVYIGEKRYKGTNQSITDSTYTNLNMGGVSFDTTTAGYAVMYDEASDVWTIPPGLAGIWSVFGVVQFDANATGRRILRIRLNGATSIFSNVVPSPSATALSVVYCLVRAFNEGDTIETQAWQNSGGSLNLLGGEDSLTVTMSFMGVGGNV